MVVSSILWYEALRHYPQLNMFYSACFHTPRQVCVCLLPKNFSRISFVTLFYKNKRGVGHFCLPLQFHYWIIFAAQIISSTLTLSCQRIFGHYFPNCDRCGILEYSSLTHRIVHLWIFPVLSWFAITCRHAMEQLIYSL